MPNTYFQFKQFTVHQEKCAMKVSTEACILGAWAKAHNPNRILDIGAGTGLLSLMLAQRYECDLDAVELDKQAAQQAEENTEDSTWSDRINVYSTSIQKFAKSTKRKYDLIVCNPPFFQGSLKSDEPAKNIAKHETLFFDKKILAEALNNLLTANGSAFVIYPEQEHEIFMTAIQTIWLKGEASLVIRNQPDKPVFRIISKITRSKLSENEELLTIRNGKEYSPAMKNLLSEYYL